MRAARGSGRFAGATAVVTGAAAGIGRALAVELATRGARVAASDVDEVGLAETVRCCPGGRARGYRVDVADRDAVLQHAEDVVHDFGAVHVVVNNAGIVARARAAGDQDRQARAFARFARTTPEHAARVILRGVERGRPRIVVGADGLLAAAAPRLLGTGYQRLAAPATRVLATRIGLDLGG